MDNHIEKSEPRILHSLINKKGMQNIMDTAAEVFENPLFISDPGYKIICCSDNEGICDDFWEQVKKGKHSDPAFVSQIIQ